MEDKSEREQMQKEKTYEKLDIYNENRIKTGKIIERKEDTELRWFIEKYYKITKE